MLIDAYVHVFTYENLNDANRWAWAHWYARIKPPYRDPATIFPKVGRTVWDPEGEDLIKAMDEMGVDAVINQVVDWGVVFGEESPWSIEDIQKHGYSLSQKYPGRVYNACGVDPRRYNATEILERSVKEWGAVCFQLFPANGYYPDDPVLLPVYQKCAELGIPIVVRTGHGEMGGFIRQSHPFCIETPAKMFRDVQFILAHTGGGLDALWREALLLASFNNPNIVLELSEWQRYANLFGSSKAPSRMGEFLSVLNVMRDQIGAHRIMWGTDYIKGSDLETDKKWADLFKNLPSEAKKYGYTFTQEETDQICFENAKRIFKI